MIIQNEGADEKSSEMGGMALWHVGLEQLISTSSGREMMVSAAGVMDGCGEEEYGFVSMVLEYMVIGLELDF